MIRRLVAATMAALLGPSIAFAAGPHTLRFTNADDVTTLDPVLSAETTVGLLSQLTMAYLVRYDARNQPIPELVTVVPSQRNGGISADGRTITCICAMTPNGPTARRSTRRTWRSPSARS